MTALHVENDESPYPGVRPPPHGISDLTGRDRPDGSRTPVREPHGPGLPDRDRDRHNYVVLVRHHGHWDRYRVFDDRDEAQRVVWRLERWGEDARIEVIHRHR